MYIINAGGMDETCGTYAYLCWWWVFDIHDYEDDTDHDTDDDTNDDTGDDTNDGGRGNRRLLPRGAVHLPPPPASTLGEGVRTNFQDLDPVWESERADLHLSGVDG